MILERNQAHGSSFENANSKQMWHILRNEGTQGVSGCKPNEVDLKASNEFSVQTQLNVRDSPPFFNKFTNFSFALQNVDKRTFFIVLFKN